MHGPQRDRLIDEHRQSHRSFESPLGILVAPFLTYKARSRLPFLQCSRFRTASESPSGQQPVMSLPGKVELLLCFDNRNEVALSIPLAQCETFANSPLKWLRFLGFVIYGRQGRLSTSMNGPELDYTAPIEARAYYFMSDGKLDP